MASCQTGTIELQNSSSTNKIIATNYTASTYGDRLKAVSVTTGPTTAPGGTYTITLYLYDGSNYWPFEQFTLVNSVNTMIADEYQFPNKVIPPSWSIYASVSTQLTSGATVFITFDTVALTS